MLSNVQQTNPIFYTKLRFMFGKLVQGIIILSLAVLLIIGALWVIGETTDNYLKDVVQTLKIDGKVRQNGHATYSCIEGKLYHHTIHIYPKYERRTHYIIVQFEFEMADSSFIFQIHPADVENQGNLVVFKTQNADFNSKFLVLTNQPEKANKVLNPEVQQAILDFPKIVDESIYFDGNTLSFKIKRYAYSNSAEDAVEGQEVFQTMVKSIEQINQ